MGIKGLMGVINDEAPDAVKELDVEAYMGRTVAIDASMALYQFLIAIRAGGEGQAASVLTNADGEQTSHIQGMFNRTIRLLSVGVKPIYVFDGKPPGMKGGELEKRAEKRKKAEKELAEAKEKGDVAAVEKAEGALVKVTRKDAEDVKTLLRAMGVPVVDAPCEAEAQCAELVKGGKAFAAGTEDMDVLTFATPRQLRRLTFNSNSKKGDNQGHKVVEISYDKVLTGLDLSAAQFVDFCILCGCDYTDRIASVGPKTALKLIRAHKTIENVIKSLSKITKEKDKIPDDWLDEVSRNERKAKKRKQALQRLQAAENDAKAKAASNNDDADEAPVAKDDDDDEVPEKNDNGGFFAATTTMEDDVVEPNFSFAATTNDIDDKPDEPMVPTEEKDEPPKVDEEPPKDAPPTDDKVEKDVPMPDAAKVEDEEPPKEDEVLAPKVDDDNDDDDKDQDEPAGDDNKVEEPEKPYEPLYIGARRLFTEHEVTPAKDVDIKFTKPDEPALRAFLVDKMGFNADRVEAAIKKLNTARSSLRQQRVDSFFTVIPKKDDGKSKKRSANDSKKPAAANKKDSKKAKKK